MKFIFFIPFLLLPMFIQEIILSFFSFYFSLLPPTALPSRGKPNHWSALRDHSLSLSLSLSLSVWSKDEQTETKTKNYLESRWNRMCMAKNVSIHSHHGSHASEASYGVRYKVPSEILAGKPSRIFHRTCSFATDKFRAQKVRKLLA